MGRGHRHGPEGPEGSPSDDGRVVPPHPDEPPVADHPDSAAISHAAVVPDAADRSRAVAAGPSDEPRSQSAAWEFWTIEVCDSTPDSDGAIPPVGARPGTYSARRWKDGYGEALLEAAITHGAKEWAWVFQGWGVLLELGFADEADWLRLRATPAVQAALDAVPDPVNGLFVYPGRGGSSGSRVPRKPRPRPQAGVAIPEDDLPQSFAPPLGGHRGAPAPTRPTEAGVLDPA